MRQTERERVITCRSSVRAPSRPQRPNDWSWKRRYSHFSFFYKQRALVTDIWYYGYQLLSQAESGNTKSTALSVIPFSVSPEVSSAFAQFLAQTINYVELTIRDETIVLVHSRTVTLAENLSEIVSKDIAT